MTATAPAYSAGPPRERARPVGATLWLTGLPSAGKSTIAAALAGRLRAHGRAVEVLDGDDVRPVMSPDLGYSRADRDANVARIGWVAPLLARHGVLVLASVVSPTRAPAMACGHTHDLKPESSSSRSTWRRPSRSALARREGFYARQRAANARRADRRRRRLPGADPSRTSSSIPATAPSTTSSTTCIALLHKENLLPRLPSSHSRRPHPGLPIWRTRRSISCVKSSASSSVRCCCSPCGKDFIVMLHLATKSNT